MMVHIRHRASLLAGLALLACLTLLVGTAAADTKPKKQLPKTLQPQPLSPPEPPPSPLVPLEVPWTPLTPEMETVKPKDPIPGKPPKKQGQRQFKLKLMSFNINSIVGPFGIPWVVNYPEPWHHNNYKRAARTQEIIEESGADIIVIDEAFDKAAEEMLKRLAKIYKYQTPLVGERCTGEEANPEKEEWNGTYGNCSNGITIRNGGTVIISKLPISERWQYVFREGIFPDSKANKGVALAAFKVPGGGVFWVAGTHLQAEDSNPYSPNGKYERMRRQQLIEMSDFIRYRANVAKEPVLVAGDLNVPIYYDELWNKEGQLPMNWGNHAALNLFTPVKESGKGVTEGVSVNCVKNKIACAAQWTPYPVGYEDSLDYLGYYAGTKAKPGVRPLDQSPPLVINNTLKQIGNHYMSPSDHFPTWSVFTLAMPEPKNRKKGSSNGNGQQAGGQQNNGSGGGQKPQQGSGSSRSR